ncbi:Tat pathway signal protein [Streptomyces qinzhouensis]|uniref:Tat pathway signal protein n=1 Tax=Streptomyces qinzhouensis TaxID=2599401 RepID=UPI00319E7DC1
MCQALSRRLKRVVTLDEIGLGLTGPAIAQEALEWHADPVSALTDLGRSDLDANRRTLLGQTVYSAAALVVPGQDWWQTMAKPSPDIPTGRQRVGRSDVATVQELTVAFSRMDQRCGGGHGRGALVQYLYSDVRSLLCGRFQNEDVRREMHSAAAELSYLSGWMAFDNAEHAIAQKYFLLAVKLSARAGNAPLSGHILRAMAHQAIDLGFANEGLNLAEVSIQGERYKAATPREKALLGVIHARGLAATGRRQPAIRALLQAEDDLASATSEILEPNRTFFFSEASLAHETACALRDMGDHAQAIRQFRRSANTRGAAFKRTHAVTLGYLGSEQMAGGRVDEACATWNRVLDAMEEGIYSGRARQAVLDMRALLSPYRRRGIPAVTELEARAVAYLKHVDWPTHTQG